MDTSENQEKLSLVISATFQKDEGGKSEGVLISTVIDTDGALTSSSPHSPTISRG